MNSKKQTSKILFESPSISTGEEPEIKKSDFEFIKKLGDGAFGQVWKVVHKSTKEEYAIKQVAKEKVIKMNSQFKREVFIMYNLSHANIAKLYNHFEDEKFFYLIMEICEGGNLFNKLHKQKYFMEFEAASFFIQVLKAVSYLHSHSPAIIHRDIKPENILLTKDNLVKLTDFGWSNYYSSDQQPRTTICGTPEYLPPEMVESKSHDTSADIWCLGVLLYEMLVGHTPFRSQVRSNMLINISRCKPKFPLSFPEQAKDLISRILVKKAQDRLSIKQILDHSWVVNMSLGTICDYQVIELPQYNGKFYVETGLGLRNYRIIGEKVKVKCLEIPSVQSTNEGLQSTNRTNQNEESSSVSNLTLSDSVVSDGEISKDILDELCQRESLKLIKENLQSKQNSARASRVLASQMGTEIRSLAEKVKEVQGRVNQKLNEANCVAARVQACQDLLWKTDQELNQTFHSFDSEETSKMSHELKQKYMSTCRSSEIIKKKLGTFISKNQELDKILEGRENELEALRSELETLKSQQKKLEDNTEITLLEINKEVLISQLNPNTVFNQKTVENFHRELSGHFNQLNAATHENLSEKICDLIEATKQKILKLDHNTEELRKKFTLSRSEVLTSFKRSKEAFLDKLENDRVSQIRHLADNYRMQKLQIREDLQREKMNEFKFLVSGSNYEEIVEVYRVRFT